MIPTYISDIVDAFYAITKQAGKSTHKNVRLPARDKWPAELLALHQDQQLQDLEIQDALRRQQWSLSDDEIVAKLNRDKLLGKNTYKKEDINVGILGRNDILVIPRSGEARLGHGAWSEVYEALYHGMRAIAKITDSYKDALAYHNIQKVRDSAPIEVAKHLPIIHKVTRDDLTNRFIIVMEVLRPVALPQLVRITANEFELKRQLLNLQLTDMAQDIGNKAGQLISTLKRAYYMANQLNDVDGLVLDHLPIWRDILIALANNKEFEAQKSLGSIIGPYIKDGALLQQHIIITSALSRIVNMHFPERAIDDPQWEALEESGADMDSLKTALIWLKNNAGIVWQDVTDANVMMRASTGDLVLSDVGNFVAE